KDQKTSEDENGQNGREEVKRQEQMHAPAEPVTPGKLAATEAVRKGWSRTGWNAIHHQDSWIVRTRSMWTPRAFLESDRVRPGLAGRIGALTAATRADLGLGARPLRLVLCCSATTRDCS